MVSHYEKKKPLTLKEYNERQLVEREEIVGAYHRWTDQGRECEALKQGCSFCSMAQYGFSRHEVGTRRCWQPEANEQLRERDKELLAKGIAPPEGDTRSDAYNRTTLRKKWR